MEALRRGAAYTALLGCFVAASSTGTLAPHWILEGVLALGWIPLLQYAVVGALVRAAGCERPWTPIVSGYWGTHGPWAVLLAAASAIAVAAPDHRAHAWLQPLFGWGLLGAWLVSSVLKARYLRRVLGISRIRTAAILVAVPAAHIGFLLAFIILTRQLPIPVLRGYL